MISNESLFQYLIQQKSAKSLNDSTVFASVFQNSQDPIFCFKQNETIETVNPAVSTLFGFIPEEILGQHLSSVLSSYKCKDIFN